MLNQSNVQTLMAARGLNQAALADACGVSRESASKWLSGESLPRPAKLRIIADVLGASLEDLLRPAVRSEPVIAYRTHKREALTGKAKARALEMGRHFRQLVPFIGPATLLSPRRLKDPVVDEGYIRSVVDEVRSSLKLRAEASPSRAQLIDLLHDVGAHIVPVMWGKERVGHENALTIYLPDSETTWIVLSLAAGADDFKYWLAHELGHCLSLHRLADDAGEQFAERFAQLLVFPDPLAEQCLAAMRTAEKPIEEALYFAGRHDVSIVTAVKSADRVAISKGEARTGAESQKFYEEWNQNRPSRPTVARDVFGTDSPTVDEFVMKSQDYFRTRIFDGIARLQRAQGGHSPSLVATLLDLDLVQASALSSFLGKTSH